MSTNREHERHSLESLELGDTPDGTGPLFISGAVGVKDMSYVKIVHSGVDTVRQLYRGELREDVLEFLEKQSELKEGIIEFQGQNWAFGKMGKNSGFRYRLQNNDLGVIILVGSYYAKTDERGVHLKIELSPSFIMSETYKNEIQTYMNTVACHFYDNGWKPSGVAVHMCCDVQGWEPELDFRQKFKTRSRIVQDFNGISNFEFNGIAEISVEYGDNQGYLFGKSTALQMSIYRKDLEIVKRDKVDFWHNTWNAFAFGGFEQFAPVWRVEARVHHNIIREIGIGMGETFEQFSDVVDYLADIWRYSLTSNRLNLNREYVDPFWQLIRSDAEFYMPELGVLIRREKKVDVEGVGRNYSQIIGNMVSVGARQSWGIRDLMVQLKHLSFFDDMLNYYQTRGVGESDLREKLEKALCLRRLTGKAA